METKASGKLLVQWLASLRSQHDALSGMLQQLPPGSPPVNSPTQNSGHNPYQRSNYSGSYISSQNAKNNVSSFTQRIMSAKLLRVKQLQNQLAETQLKLNEVLNENKTLRTLQQRQDNVLKKYEGNQEQLPHLLKSHHEEIRILNEKYKQIRSSYRELENRMKQKDSELTNLREQYKHLLKLSRDKQLGNREKLTKKVEEMESIIEQQRSKIYTLEKKLSLEEKNHKYQLSQEVNKHKKTQSELNSALESINNLKSTLEAKDRFANTSYPRFQKGIVNPQIHDKGLKSSHVSLPAPPRVSIRQTQRLAHSATVMPHEESETADSLTPNYSPQHHGSFSADSDNSSAGNQEENLNKGTLIPLPQSMIRKTRDIGSVQGGINVSKELFRRRREVRKSCENSEVANRENVGENPAHFNKQTPLENTLKDGISLHPPKNKDDEYKDSACDNNTEQGPKGAILLNEENHGEEMFSQEELYVPNMEDSLLGEIEKEVNSNKSGNNKTEDDVEFENLLQSTRLTDEAISELYRRDFRAEIFELEKKFQDLNKVSEKYINGKKMSSTSIHISVSDDSESEGEAANAPIPQTRRINGDKEDAIPIPLRRKESSEQVEKQTATSLGETQKASLLAALSNIDASDRRASQESGTSVTSNNEGTLTGKITEADVIAPTPRTKRKTEVMKDLFGIEGGIL